MDPRSHHSDRRRLCVVAIINWLNDETARKGREKSRVQQKAATIFPKSRCRFL